MFLHVACVVRRKVPPCVSRQRNKRRRLFRAGLNDTDSYVMELRCDLKDDTARRVMRCVMCRGQTYVTFADVNTQLVDGSACRRGHGEQ